MRKYISLALGLTIATLVCGCAQRPSPTGQAAGFSPACQIPELQFYLERQYIVASVLGAPIPKVASTYYFRGQRITISTRRAPTFGHHGTAPTVFIEQRGVCSVALQ